jgi:hypothetical protein
VLTALMVTGRVGSGIAAELGSMVVTEQISALRSLGTDPIRKLAVPRIVAATVMVPVLTVLSDAVGMVGGMFISVTQLNEAGSVYWAMSRGARGRHLTAHQPVILQFTHDIGATSVCAPGGIGGVAERQPIRRGGLGSGSRRRLSRD